MIEKPKTSELFKAMADGVMEKHKIPEGITAGTFVLSRVPPIPEWQYQADLSARDMYLSIANVFELKGD